MYVVRNPQYHHKVGSWIHCLRISNVQEVHSLRLELREGCLLQGYVLHSYHVPFLQAQLIQHLKKWIT